VIDIQARQTAVDALTRFFIHTDISNFQYMDQFPHSNDPAIRSIWWMLWGCYDDLREHKMVGRYAVSPDALEVVNRCVLFLSSSREYEWDSHVFSLKRATRAWLLSLRRLFRRPAPLTVHEQIQEVLSDEPQGDARVWPFYRPADYDEARQQTLVG
jgi:hypothetical protein